MRVLYINAMMSEPSGEALKHGLIDGFQLSYVAKTKGVEVDSYDIFYGKKMYPRQMARALLNTDYDAIVLSGSEKNTTDDADPWVVNYIEGLRELLDIPRAGLAEWDGPPLPILGICFGHQALAVALGGETGTFIQQVGARDSVALPQAKKHPVFAPLLENGASTLRYLVYHGDHVIRMPRGFHAIFGNSECAIDGMAHDKFPIVSLQPHPEMDARIQAASDDRETWARVPASAFAGNAGPATLASFIDWVGRGAPRPNFIR